MFKPPSSESGILLQFWRYNMDGIVKNDLPHVVWKNKSTDNRGVEKIAKDTEIDIIDKIYNYCINGFYYRAQIKADGRIYYILPEDVETAN